MAIDISRAAKEAYTWHVTLRDDSEVPEFDDVRTDGRGFGEVDKAQVSHVHLRLPDGTHSHVVAIPDGAEPVFFRRRKIELDPNTDEQKLTTIHCIGWKRGGSDIYPLNAVYLFVFGDGSVLLTSDFQAV